MLLNNFPSKITEEILEGLRKPTWTIPADNEKWKQLEAEIRQKEEREKQELYSTSE